MVGWNPSYNSRYASFNRPLEGRVNDYDDFSAVYQQMMGRDIASILLNLYLPIFNEALDRDHRRFLDLACGSGDFIVGLAAIHRELGLQHTYRGIDKSKGQIARANALREERCVNVKFVHSDVVHSDIFNTNFLENDVITMNLDAINHLREPDDWHALMERVHACLVEDGLFLFDMNTVKRLRYDWRHPEVIVKPDMTYIQLGSDLSEIGGFTRRRLYMEIFAQGRKAVEQPHGDVTWAFMDALQGFPSARAVSSEEYARFVVNVEQIAPPNDVLFDMLEEHGFEAEELEMSDEQRAQHVIMKNRLFVKARKV